MFALRFPCSIIDVYAFVFPRSFMDVLISVFLSYH